MKRTVSSWLEKYLYTKCLNFKEEFSKLNHKIRQIRIIIFRWYFFFDFILDAADSKSGEMMKVYGLFYFLSVSISSLLSSFLNPIKLDLLLKIS